MENVVNMPASPQAIDHQPPPSSADTLTESMTPIIRNSSIVSNPHADIADPSPYSRPLRSASSVSRRSQLSRASTKEVVDPNLDINLPYRTLSPNANLAEYVVAVPQGEIPGPPKEDGKEQYKLVTFTPNDPENPKNWSKAYKWYCTMVVALTCFVVAFSSSVITADFDGPPETFHVSQEVGLLAITVFVVGFGVGKSLPGDPP